MVVTLIGMVLVASCDQSPFKKASCWAFLWVLPDVNNHRNCQHHGKEDGLKCQKFKYDLYKFLHVVVSTDVEMFMTLSDTLSHQRTNVFKQVLVKMPSYDGLSSRFVEVCIGSIAHSVNGIEFHQICA